MKSISKFCAILVMILSKIEWSVEDIDLETKILQQQLEYKESSIKRLTPPRMKGQSNQSVNVDVNMFISSIGDVDEINMELNVQVTFRMSWVDPRLAYQDLNNEYREKEPIQMISLTDTSKIWIPDIYFTNEKRSQEHNPIQPNLFLRISPNGTVLFSKRISLTLGCPMNFNNYPHDSQICKIRISTYHSTTNYMLLRWKPHDPIQISKNLFPSKFILDEFKSSENAIRTSTGEYSVLVVDLLLSRDFFSYFKKFYLPVVIVVLISWIPLWLERVLILRIYIAMSTVMFLGWYYTVQDTGLLISYNTAVNSWNAANFIFVLLAALQSVGIVFMIKTNTNAIKRIHPDDNNEFKMLPHGPDKRKVFEIVDEKPNVDVEIMKIKTNFKICFINVQKEVQIIDAVAKLFFPSAYVLFLFFYWITYY